MNVSRNRTTVPEDGSVAFFFGVGTPPSTHYCTIQALHLAASMGFGWIRRSIAKVSSSAGV